MTFSLQKLTEGIRDRHVGQQNKRLVEKWSRTGLLRGMGDVNRENMATLLENQAAQVLRESSSMTNGDVGGFSNIAFPIVRRVFGGLIANELVSIQPMSLPSGLLFYLDYTYGTNQGPHANNESIYGGPAGSAIQNGADAAGGQYDLVGAGYTRTYSSEETKFSNGGGNVAVAGAKLDTTNSTHLKLIDFDQSVIDENATEPMQFFYLPVGGFTNLDKTLIKSLSLTIADGAGTPVTQTEAVGSKVQGGSTHNVRKVTKLGSGSSESAFDSSVAESSQTHVLVLVQRTADSALALGAGGGAAKTITVSYPKADVSVSGADAGEVEVTPSFESDFGSNPSPAIPEIDIKIESIPVTAQTRKLRARWSPELAQDLNAYHSMDAEVELTQILSEQIALEIDREILNDLLTGAKGANFFWSRSPGKFVNKKTGSEIERTSTLNPGPAFTGTVREWYETLTETVIDVANEIHRKTLRGSANFIVVSPDVATILEASVLYRPSYSLDGDGQVGTPFTMGAEKVGTLSNRFTVYKDPYFPRNKILVGYKGGSYLETGFVYAPYVPLIVTPTIFQPDDFTPRKGVMTRYGKKMVRADFYGTVTCLDMNII
tara:strand:+ start:735 stop:2540 length:1806 start_codon:yes stop_codon:yes gene_type:complete